MEDPLRGQVTRSAAEVYEEFFVPALFQEWAPRVVSAAGVGPGQRVLDVACGTGVVAREAARRVEPGGSVAGLDRNDDMIAVARRVSPALEWRLGRAEALPFGDGSFDAVLCQFGLMFFDDRVTTLREMSRVLKPGGRTTVAVWDALESSPGYAAMARLLQRLFGDRVADQLRFPFALGSAEALRSLFREAGMRHVGLQTLSGMARFPSIESWVHTDIKGWTLAQLIDESQYQTLLTVARRELAPFVRPEGTVEFGIAAHIVTAARP